MLTVPHLGESSRIRAPRPRVSQLRVLWLKEPLSWAPRPRRVSQSTRLPVRKSPSRTSLVHPSPIHASNVTVPVLLLVTARRSLLNRDLQIGLRVRDLVRVRLFNFSSHELLSLPKTNMKNKGYGNVTGLKFENRTRIQFRTCSQIWRSLFTLTP